MIKIKNGQVIDSHNRIIAKINNEKFCSDFFKEDQKPVLYPITRAEQYSVIEFIGDNQIGRVVANNNDRHLIEYRLAQLGLTVVRG